jgi:hypothetical protein
MCGIPAETSAFAHVSIIIATAVLPLIFLGVLTLAKWVVEEKPFWERGVDVGWDMCILGVGLAAGLFSDKEFVEFAGGQVAVFATSAVLGADLFLAFLILLMMKHRKFTARFGTFAVILGILAVSVPCGLLMWRWL